MPSLADELRWCDYPSHPAPARVRLTVMADEPCPYLPARAATHRAVYVAGDLPPDAYRAFMDRGFRRSGRVVYQPVCRGCRVCVPLRVPVATFVPSKSQRRIDRRNADLRVSVGPPRPTRDKFDLYARYVRDWHGHTDAPRWDAFVAFLYDSPTGTVEFTYVDPRGAIVAVALCDVSPATVSSVYVYWDPAERRRGLGTYTALRELAWARDRGAAHYYLGYWVHGCGQMEYKATYRPCELLDADGVWRPM